jgi:hypothetical protein
MPRRGRHTGEAVENVEDAARVIIELSTEKGLPLPPEVDPKDTKFTLRAETLVKISS